MIVLTAFSAHSAMAIAMEICTGMPESVDMAEPNDHSDSKVSLVEVGDICDLID
jgi:hypothetical protein